MNTISRFRLLASVTLLTGTALLAACGSDHVTTTTTNKTTTTEQSAVPMPVPGTTTTTTTTQRSRTD